ncbi:helix-turn-helix transcriptional regulator [Shewanella sp. 202IG2-18]|uniref:helix-turn-helix domain-containing protein n=1 Tax=Parashewanella hymeniacidonis TaxID=2807618 RepID=UPI001960B2C2|nr:helix-turn-helix transcriptional regulator [Parashewanella hymeniacidonis]MBM7070903.1 helix-turn-helix transcriptional regulator [Parashewanella hymeniacidonis]
MEINNLRELIPAHITQVDIAESCNVSQQAVSQWFTSNVVPANRAQIVHKLTGVPLQKLNPAVFCVQGGK